MYSPARFAAFLLLPASLGVAAADGQGLSVDPERLAWPVVQARLQVGAEALAHGLGSADGATLRPRSAALFGDYYVSKPYFGTSGGMRLTSGVVVGPRGAVFGPGQATAASGGFAFSSISRPLGSGFAEAGGELLAWPYLGVGYSGGSLRGGWGFSADLGLAAQNPGVLRLGSQALDESLRDLRLTPVLQLGVSYRF